MAEFSYDADKHIYRLVEQQLPSVTDVLVDNGFIDPEFYTEEGKLRGTRVHMLCQFYDEGDYSPEEADRFGLAGYVESWRKLRVRMPFVIIENERPMYHRRLLYAGTPDRVVMFPDSNMGAIIDIKTGSPEKWHGLQSAAYADMVPPGFNAFKRFGVHLHADGSLATLRPHEGFSDFAAFAQMLACTKLRRAHGVSRR